MQRQQPAAAVEYEQPRAYVTRGKYLVLLILTLLNTLLLALWCGQPLVLKALEFVRQQRAPAPIATPAPVLAPPPISPPAPAAAIPTDEETAFAEQTRWMTYALPPGEVAYDENPDAASRLLRQSGYSALPAAAFVGDRIAVSTAWQSPVCRDLPTPCFWLEHGDGCATLFLHQRVSPNGYVRLVQVVVRTEASKRLAGNGYRIEVRRTLRAVVWFPGTPTMKPNPSYRSGNHELGSEDASTDSLAPDAKVRYEPGFLRFYAGQPDPNNRAHFTIRYDLGGEGGTLHGTLDDSDAVNFQDVPDRKGKLKQLFK